MAQQGRLRSYFSSGDTSRESQKKAWAELWDTDQSELWDRGTPSAALIDWLEARPAHLALANVPRNGERLTALVPGCGRGYDVVMLALHGFDVVGLESSPKAAEAARAYAQSELADPHGYNFGDALATAPPAEAAGSVTIVIGDFFDDAWSTAQFDLIYDYTFLCALHPSLRKDWARRMHELLRPSGVLVCLEFPLFKSRDEPGPPWPLQGVHWNLLAEGGNGMEVDDNKEADTSTKGPFVRLDYISPRRSYPQGRGTDMVSVWGLRGSQGRDKTT
ncbi:hypothetical protein SPBR_03055 [Sporothrix brasiliensis 5110]|uniref:S-adenosyl-L-methionine-dependent methyltransferase n=1 Tax=Sporothrix brasiliensis 5110 TaxID=1398154 RepID=A0A0C2F1Q0_9PEZI|nr:uncharacterized protein SPBR_03055 [Sporothrix brasiliensis 5110]KIH92854.1 hypothetical protein SPBR_03055 [Sporothrix brasiliensis 5110]